MNPDYTSNTYWLFITDCIGREVLFEVSTVHKLNSNKMSSYSIPQTAKERVNYGTWIIAVETYTIEHEEIWGAAFMRVEMRKRNAIIVIYCCKYNTIVNYRVVFRVSKTNTVKTAVKSGAKAHYSLLLFVCICRKWGKSLGHFHKLLGFILLT